MSKKKTVQFIFCTLLSILLLYLAFTKVEFATVIEGIKNANIPFLVLAIILFFMSFFARSFLWKTLLNLDRQASIWQLFKSIIIGYMGNILLPLRAGELLRIYSIKKLSKVHVSESLSSITVERVLDLISLIIFTGILSFYIEIPEEIGGPIKLFVVASLLAFAFLIYLANTPYFYKYIHWLIQFFPERHQAKADAILKNFIMGLSTLKRMSIISEIIVLSLICWGCVYFSIYFALHAYNLDVNWMMPLALLVILNIGLTIPMLPAYLGIYPFFTVMALSLFGIEKSVSLGFSLVLQFIDFVPVLILGMIFFLQENMSAVFIKKITKKN